MNWSLSCPDWQDRIRRGESLLPALPLVAAEADRAVAIFNRLRLPDVPGQPLLSDAAGDWFRDLVRALFGSYDPAAGERFIRELFVLVPKKNSKTTGGAAVMLTAMLMSRRPRAEFLLVAPTQEVSDLAFRQAVGMIDADSVLSAKCHIQEHIKRITYRPTGCFLKVKSFDPKVVTGSKPAGVLLDELHVMAEAHDADRVIGQLRGGLISQPEGFLVTITTQSERQPAGVFRSELMKARKVRDGSLQAPILPLLYEFPPDVDWRDRKNWWMVTPNNGRSVTVERLLSDYEAANAGGDEELRRWASQHLNVEIGLALHSDRWAGADFWEKQGDPALTLEAILSRSEVVTIGIDGGGLDDLFGLAVLGRDAATQDWLAWCHAYCASIALDRRKAEASTLRDFERDGDLEIVDALPGDVAAAVAVIKRVYERGLLGGIGIDPEKGYKVVYQALIDAGLPEDLIHGVSQGWRLVGAITVAERRLVDGSLRHSGSRLMNYCVGNARVVPRGNAVLITKEASGEGKIDPLMALLDAVDLMAMNPGRQTISVYEQLARDAAAQPAPQALATPASESAVSAAAAPFEANRFDHQALQYIVNTAGQAGVAEFEDDFAPIGTRLWEHLAAAGLVTVDERGAVCLTAAGVAVLADETEEIEA